MCVGTQSLLKVHTYCGDNVWKKIYKCVSNSYSALSVRYGSNTARGPRASAVFEAISHTERTITIIYAVTTAPYTKCLAVHKWKLRNVRQCNGTDTQQANATVIDLRIYVRKFSERK